MEPARLEAAVPPVPEVVGPLDLSAQPTSDRYRWMVETVNEVIFEADPAGMWTYLNPAWTRLLGYPVEDCLGRPFLDFVHPDDRDRNLQAFIDTVQGGKSHCRLAARYLAAAGQARHMEVSAWIFRAPDGTPLGSTGTITDVTERTLAERELEQRATHDPLTGLPNRALLAERLADALRHATEVATSIALLFLDLDRFKLVNDSLGHDVGDEVLRVVADRLRAVAPPSCTVGRFGGDELVVLATGVDEHAVRSLAARIRTAIAAPVPVGDTEVALTASVGIRLLHAGELTMGDPVEQAKALLRDADTAMYDAKESGRDRTEFFGHATRARVVVRLETETLLRRAADNGELSLHYQPQLDLRSGSVVGVEALLRWHHPVRGPLLPADFIGVAEESGLIVPIGRWVLDEACRFATEPGSPGAGLDHVAVNVSARQLSNGLVAHVASAIVESGIAPRRLVLELTESALLTDAEMACAAMGALTDLGVTLSLDDFGTGYSSLSYLQRLPLRELKIDRTFVGRLGHPDGRAIVSAVVALADALGLGTCAEGVERESDARLLSDLGCRRAQGWWWAMAVPADELAEVLRRVAAGGGLACHPPCSLSAEQPMTAKSRGSVLGVGARGIGPAGRA
jgi:diguanylate cyclase (GGDEF)-like protein/PAS domain S-box-containing protein